MDREDLEIGLAHIFEPDVDEDGFAAAFPPHSRLRDRHGLDTSYWKRYEFGSTSPFSRLVRDASDPINTATQSLSAPTELFSAGLRLFGDSLLAYSGTGKKRTGPLQYYPAILMTFWAGFEAFVRLYSEILVQVKPSIPLLVRDVLLESEAYLDRNGTPCSRTRQRPILDRYWLMLKFGYGLEYDRGGEIWQCGEASLARRNEFVHYEVNSAPSINTSVLHAQLEAIMLLLIGPSTLLARSVFSRQYEIYWMLAEMQPLIEDFEERTFFKGIMGGGYLFPCTFEEVDEDRYPTGSERPFIPF
jgi:hypothetical protein